MVDYYTKVEMAKNDIIKIIKSRKETPMEALYRYAYMKYTVGKKPVNTLIEHLIGGGQVQLRDDIVVNNEFSESLNKPKKTPKEGQRPE